MAVHERLKTMLQFDNFRALLIEHLEFHSCSRTCGAARRSRYRYFCFFMPGSVPIILHSTISITSSAPPPIEVRRLSR